MEFSGNFKSLIDIGGNLATVKLGGIPGSVKSSGFFGCGVDNNKNLRLVDFGKFP